MNVPPRYREMVNSNGALFHLMPAVEINIAKGILRWVHRANNRLCLAALQDLPCHQDHVPWDQMPCRLIYDAMGARTWLAPDDASPYSLLWEVSLRRAARWLNTGSPYFSYEQDRVVRDACPE